MDTFRKTIEVNQQTKPNFICMFCSYIFFDMIGWAVSELVSYKTVKKKVYMFLYIQTIYWFRHLDI